MARIYLGLGTNLGQKKKNLESAVAKINEEIGEVTSLSSFYETAPWGFESENSFLNAVCCVTSDFTPKEVLDITKHIEVELGRTSKSSKGVYHDRLIDIDILLFDNRIIETPELTIPHPMMTERDFVMKPLREIAPNLLNPITGKKLFD